MNWSRKELSKLSPYSRKASSIQFLHFLFTDAQVTVGIGHQKYGHLAGLPENVRQALAQDFD